MKSKKALGLLFLISAAVFAQNSSPNHAESDSPVLSMTPQAPVVDISKPLIAGAASLLFPGAGQLYTGRPVKAGTFVAFEAIAASMAYYWHTQVSLRKDLSHRYADSASAIRKAIQSSEPGRYAGDDAVGETPGSGEWRRVAQYSELSALAAHTSREAACRSSNALVWAASGHVFNVLDAVGSSGYFLGTEIKDPARAGWLSAVPGLGLGQIYNGSVSKAGMAFMTQLSLGTVAWNYHQLMVQAEKEYQRLNNPNDFSFLVKSGYSDDWALKRRNAFRSRNTVLWYSIFSYFYWILDAVVDAHLHDYPEKMRIQPDLEPRGDGLTLGVTVKF